MPTFTSDSRMQPCALTVIITLAVLAVGLSLVFFYVRYQKQSQPGPSSGPVIVPGMLRPGDSNFEYYKNKIRIENVKASLGITFSQARVAFVSGMIVNDGDRKLEALEMRIRLFDLYDRLSKERTTTPLRPGVGLYKPMEPLERRSFSIGVESVEQLWNPKRLEMEITGLKYQ